MKLIFWLVKNKVDTKKEVPIYCRITIDGKRAEFATGLRVKESDFDVKKKRIKGSNKLSEKYNRRLEEICYKLNNIYFNEILGKNTPPTAQDVKDLFRTKRKTVLILSDLLTDYATENYRIFNQEYKYKRHKRFIKILNKVLTQVNKTRVKISGCNHYLFDQIAHNLVNECKYSVGYSQKVFSFLKAALKYAYNKRYVDRIYAHDYILPFTNKTEVVYLEEWELEKITGHRFKGALQQWADLFVIQCYTGLAYVDLTRLNASHLKKDNQGLLWINITRQKVDTAECNIPVISKVWNLLKKYNFDLPQISNQKYNEALKKIAKEVGIKKNLTTHVGRKTYGTLLLNKDVPIETVSRLLGHSSIKTTEKHYAKVLHMKIARDIRRII
ncbi:MAG: site-specific integrase [Carboxylicivirga sp.]|jgi:integrase|nr:site-specific integrase [Carboxylicivirga sp.]